MTSHVQAVLDSVTTAQKDREISYQKDMWSGPGNPGPPVYQEQSFEEKNKHNEVINEA